MNKENVIHIFNVLQDYIFFIATNGEILGFDDFMYSCSYWQLVKYF